MKKIFLFLGIGVSLSVFQSSAHAGFWDFLFPAKKQTVSTSQDSLKQINPSKLKQLVGFEVSGTRWVNIEKGASGKQVTLTCPYHTVVSELVLGLGGYDTGCGEGWKSGCGPAPVLGSLIVHCKGSSNDPAQQTLLESTIYTARTEAGIEKIGNATEWKNVFCPGTNAVGGGVVGRSGDRLDSFGLACREYFLPLNKIPTFVDSPKVSVPEPETGYGGYWGDGGSPFEMKGEEGEALVSITVNTGEDGNIVGLHSLGFAKPIPKYMKAIFPVDSE